MGQLLKEIRHNPLLWLLINDEILGNSEPALHAHCFPRYDSEPEPLSSGPI